MIFRVVFLLFALVSLGCFVMAAKVKRRNVGFLILTAFVIASDIICFFLLGCKSVVDARNVLTAYYICYAWFYFGAIWTLSSLGRHKHRLYRIPVALICLCQTAMIGSNLTRNRIMSFSRHLMLGQAWWIAEEGKSKIPLFSFRNYNILICINILIIFILMVVCCIHSAKLFRARLLALILIHIILTATEIITAVRSLPVWIICLVMNIICILCLYYVNYYANRKLQDWSLLSFANEMSDGFILYNEYDDPIHMNDLLKKLLPEELITSFRVKEKLDEWISDTVMVDDMELLQYEGDNGKIYFKVRKNELFENGYPLGTIYILHDTTDSILRIQAMEEANVELERAAKMKSDFLANMSHEIRTPMNAVIGMAEIALREILPPHVEDYLLQIQNSGRNLLNIINDILDFSKIEAGKMEIIPDRYEPLSELNDIANVLATRIGDKHLELFVIMDNNIPHALEGDVMRIRQIIINLANNAIKFTREGIVNIRVLCEKISEDEVMMTFHVIDTGQGIKEEDLSKLFVSFQQVDSKRNRSVEGTGLGLAISQRLCEAMGGSIGVTSEYGKGSDFYFNVPQKIIDPKPDLVVKDAETKHAFVINENPGMLGMFIDEMNKLSVDGHIIRSLSEYQPTGERDYLFFEEDLYGHDIRSFLNAHKEIVGVILVSFDSIFEPDLPNLRVMRRPETTLGMVMTLNDQEILGHSADSTTAFKIDFVAPDARILIVDDNAINITIAEGLLKPIHAQCFGASSGKEAIEKIKKQSFDVIMMDHMMPEMDGVETTKVIRETIPEIADTPIIALTANAMEGVKEMFLDAGMNDFVAKPIDIRDLITKLKQWLPAEKMLKGEQAQAALSALPEEDADDAVQTGQAEETVIFDGLDGESAMKALGSAELYRKIVGEYYRSGEDKLREIQAAYDALDLPDYTIKVHALKSSSRQIGAVELGNMAEQLENAGHAEDVDTIHAKTAETLNVFRELLDKLSGYFAEEETDAGDLEEITAEELLRILDVLSEACDNLDMDEMESCKDELKQYSYSSDEMKDTVEALFQAIDDIDVDTCVELIEKLKSM